MAKLTTEALRTDVGKAVLRSSNNAALVGYVETAILLAHSLGMEDGLDRAIKVREGIK